MVAGTLLVIALHLARSRLGAPVGVDFRAVWGAGRALLAGRPLYQVPEFVYPPFAALVFVPLATLKIADAANIYSVIQVALPLVASVILGVSLSPRHRWLVASVCAVLLMKADVFVDSLFLYNPSLLFVLPLVAIVFYWLRSQWTTGAVLLGFTLAVKPLLLLLIMVPLLRRDWRSAGCAAGSATLLTLGMLPFTHDLPGLAALPGRILHGTDLHGLAQVLNVSLGSVGIVHPGWNAAVAVLRVFLTGAVGWLLWRTRNTVLSPVDMTVVAGALALTLPVVGSLSEIHYCVLALPACAALLSGRLGTPARILGGVAFLVLCFPLFNLHLNNVSGEVLQLRWAFGSALTLLACCLARFTPPHSTPAAGEVAAPLKEGEQAHRLKAATPVPADL